MRDKMPDSDKTIYGVPMYTAGIVIGAVVLVALLRGGFRGYIG